MHRNRLAFGRDGDERDLVDHARLASDLDAVVGLVGQDEVAMLSQSLLLLALLDGLNKDTMETGSDKVVLMCARERRTGLCVEHTHSLFVVMTWTC